MLLTIADCTFLDVFTPAKGKNEWGVDTLTRKMTGARSLLDAFLATLAQGQVHAGYFLQTWDSDEKPDVATVTLHYKGLRNGTPAPIILSEVVSAVGQTSADYSDEGTPAGIGRLYRQDVYATAGETPGIPGSVGTSIEFFRNRYAVSATAEFTYSAVQTQYRYISIGKPNGPTYNVVDIPFSPAMDRVRIVLSDGTTYGGESMLATFDLVPETDERVISFRSSPIIGTPYWECEDVVRKILTDPIEA